MKFTPTRVEGAFYLDPEPLEDSRGYFARTYCIEEFERQGLDFRISQCSVSFNRRRGTLRGMHYQLPPHAEKKLVSCTRGVIYDVVLDLRKGSSTFGQWEGVELKGSSGRMLYIPEGCAHGFQTLEDESVVFYQIQGAYVPQAASGVRWDDPLFKIVWPEDDGRMMSDKDAGYPDYGR